MIRNVQILIIAKQHRSRQSLRALLNTWQTANSISEAENYQSAVSLSRLIQPDLVIIDLLQPESSEMVIIAQIKALWPHARVICLSMYPDTLLQARQAGAEVSLSKSDSPELLLTSLERIL